MSVIRPDLSPGVDALAELTAAIAAAATTGAAVEVPGGPADVWEVSDTLHVDARVALVGNGAWIKRADSWALPKPGSGHHLAVWENSTATAVVRGVCFDGNAAGQLNSFVGDTVSVAHLAGVDFADAYTRNSRGLTTLSTPILAETFAAQIRRVARARLVRCHAWNTDGAPSATGIVFHWCDDWAITDTLVSDFAGQAIGCFGGSGKGVVEHCVSQRSHHGLNFERGTEGVGQSVTVVGGDRRSVAVDCPTAVVVNGNGPSPLGAVSIADYEAVRAAVVLDLTGLESPVSVSGLVADAPTKALVMAPYDHVTKGQPWARDLALSATVKGAPGVPVLIGPGGHEHPAPTTWKVTQA